MFYYEVLLASARYQKPVGLTYANEAKLVVGAAVVVKLQKEIVVGLIVKEVTAPTFAVQPIIRIVSDKPLPQPLINLREWLQLYYPSPSGSVIGLLLPKALVQKGRPTQTIQKVIKSKDSLPTLTLEQRMTTNALIKPTVQAALLHGDTGTGKTRVYIELAKRKLNVGQSVIVLTPEIGLTPQLVENFSAGLDHKVLYLHSDMTAAKRRDIWLECLLMTDPAVVIGPRSALFVPISNVGLIVVDEAHDSSYKQEQAPYYQATRVAAQLARLHKAQLLLGSATPLIEDYFYFETKKLPIYRMTEPAKGKHKPSVTVISLRDRVNFSRSILLSNQLINQFQDALDKGQQSVCFINRRGTARVILCNNCGWQALCPNCELPLIFHGDTHQARCHTCGYSQSPPLTCPACGSPEITYHAPGTKALVSELEKLFPNARIARFDSDNSTGERLEKRYQSIIAGSIDILVGTQILAKGLDIPKLSTVGIVTADTSLTFPDYTAEERTFQLLAQVIGRVNRGHIVTSVIVQTYQPDSITLRSAVTQDYGSFYRSQIQERQLYRLPPFCFILKLQCARTSALSAQKAAQELAHKTGQNYSQIEIVGPAPSFREKSIGKYHWQLIIKSKARSTLLDIVKELPSTWRYDIDPVDLL